MCGFSFSCSLQDDLTQDPEFLDLISKRGPDDLGMVQRSVSLTEDGHCGKQAELPFYFSLVASVLSLRGGTLIPQPLHDKQSGSLFVWNGEAWKIENQRISDNDTVAVFHTLLASCASKASICQSKFEREQVVAEAVRDVLQATMGPYSFLFFHAPTGLVFFGRDVLGRRSLLASQGNADKFHISSVSAGPVSAPWYEVETGGIFVLNVVQRSPEKMRSPDGPQEAQEFKSIKIPWLESRHALPPLNRDLALTSLHSRMPSLLTMTNFKRLLQDAVKVRLASSSQETPQHAVLFSGGVDCTLLALLMDSVLPPNHPIDLLNVAFENPRVLKAAAKGIAQEVHTPSEPNFEYALCPDRMTGLSSYEELMEVRPARQWRFVSINVPFAETQTQTELITKLMYPHNTEMDLSISLAFFFASKGSGVVTSEGLERSYTTPARVLLSGLGADELFGGYSRHARAYNRKSYEGLLEELDLDFSRLATRNLGRDDRIVGYWGREVRYPYLDEEFVSWALELPIWEKCGFSNDFQVDSKSHVDLGPGKFILRHSAWSLGLKRAACERKRAIQFGARSAKMERSGTKGSDTL